MVRLLLMFMVSRCQDRRESVDGLPLRKISAVLYEGITTGCSYSIDAAGSLSMRNARGSAYVGEAQADLWP